MAMLGRTVPDKGGRMGVLAFLAAANIASFLFIGPVYRFVYEHPYWERKVPTFEVVRVCIESSVARGIGKGRTTLRTSTHCIVQLHVGETGVRSSWVGMNIVVILFFMYLLIYWSVFPEESVY